MILAIFFTMFFCFQSTLCMITQNQGNPHKGSFACCYFKSVKKPLVRSSKQKNPRNVKADSKQPAAVYPASQDPNISKNTKSKPWSFSKLSNHSKAFLINVGSGAGAAFVDRAIYSIPDGKNPWLTQEIKASCLVAGWRLYPAMRRALWEYISRNKEHNKLHSEFLDRMSTSILTANITWILTHVLLWYLLDENPKNSDVIDDVHED